MTRLTVGTRVRLKPPARCITGWRGTGTIIDMRGGTPIAVRDGRPMKISMACDYEWARMRDQIPNPDHHAEAVAKGYWWVRDKVLEEAIANEEVARKKALAR